MYLNCHSDHTSTIYVIMNKLIKGSNFFMHSSVYLLHFVFVKDKLILFDDKFNIIFSLFIIYQICVFDNM